MGVDKNLLQIEMEVQYTVHKEAVEKYVAWSLPSFLLRYGLSKNIELQLNAPLLIEQWYENDNLVHNFNKFGNLQIGASINLWEQRNLIPATALMARVIFPLKKNEEFNVDGEIIALNFSNAINEKWILNYNIGFVHCTDNSNAGYYIVNLTYNLTQKTHFFIENSADFNTESIFYQNINIGGGLNFRKNMCLDFSVANGINHDLYYTGIRFTWVINTKK
ncbi:MAG: transporter [Flavobacterium sp.]|nr:transporter [Flavobacterium sp.]